MPSRPPTAGADPGDPAEAARLAAIEDLSRFESEGGASGPAPRAVPRAPGLETRGGDHRGRILVIYGCRHHASATVAALTARLRAHGMTVEVGDATASTMPPPEDYDVVVLGLPASAGPHVDVIARYVADHRAALAEIPTALFTVGPARTPARDGVLDERLDELAWAPTLAVTLAGEAAPPRDRLLDRIASWFAAPRPAASTSVDRVAVERFADALVIALANAAVTAERTEPHPA